MSAGCRPTSGRSSIFASRSSPRSTSVAWPSSPCISLAILLAFAPVRTDRPSGQMFFLGAGFMLLESKGVVHMALLFGSTWVVNSVVFFAILVMIFFANLYVARFVPGRFGAITSCWALRSRSTP